MDEDLSQEEYIRQVLEAYRKTPGTMGTVRRRGPDAGRATVSTRRLREGDRKRVGAGGGAPPDPPGRCPPLGTIRSLAYFLPVIEEVLELRVSPEYFEYRASQTPTDDSFANPLGPSYSAHHSSRMMENQPARLRADDIACPHLPCAYGG